MTLQARNVEFDWAGTSLRWMPTEPIASHAVSTLNLVLPEGERWFCATYAEALPLVKDDKLREDMLGFMGQESMHAETHNAVLYEFLEANEVDPKPFVAHSEYLFRKVLGPRKVRTPREERQQLVERIAFVGAIEHITAFLGDYVLNSRWEEFDADPQMTDLFRWHGAEEVEHRNVAHDVAMYFGVGYFRRNFAMAVAFAAFWVLMIRGTEFIVRQDRTMPNLGTVRVVAGILSAMRRGSLPGPIRLLKDALRYFSPSYTPDKVGNTAQAVAYLAKSPAAKAAAWS